MDDKVKRNRTFSIIGEDNVASKLTEIQVKEILSYLILNTYTQEELAKKYNIAQTEISRISRGVTWAHIYNQLSDENKEKINYNKNNNFITIKAFGENHGQTKLTEKDVLFIRSQYKKKSMSQLAKIYNVSLSTISRIIYRKTWQHI
jgi:DNA-binding MarR family transcriptional regulator